MKKTWSIISKTLSRNKQNHSLPETMTINGQDGSNTQVIAEHLTRSLLQSMHRMRPTYVRIRDHTFGTI